VTAGTVTTAALFATQFALRQALFLLPVLRRHMGV